MAAATPAMLPVPMVEARAVLRAWREEIPRTGRSRGRNREPRVADSHSRTRNRGKKPQPRDSSSPVRRKNPSSQGSHRASAARARRDKHITSKESRALSGGQGPVVQ